MRYYHFVAASYTLWLPVSMAAQCTACESYNSALKSCQRTGINDTAVGEKMDTATIHCMCTTSSSYSQMLDCSTCYGAAYPDVPELDTPVLLAWGDTCQVSQRFDENRAVLCWESLPEDNAPCLYKLGTAPGTDASTSGISALSALPSNTLSSSALRTTALASGAPETGALESSGLSSTATASSASTSTSSASVSSALISNAPTTSLSGSPSR